MNIENRKIYWIKWDTLRKRKDEGGLSLRDTSLSNKSMLTKQGWNLATQSNTLMASLFKDIYYPNTSFIHVELWYRPSPYWRGLICEKSLLDNGLGWKVGDGSHINLRSDNW